jgi:proteasome lid subunit RPN8/RPN11
MNTTRTLYVLALALLLGIATASASEAQAFQTVEAAATAGMADATALAPRYEAGGSIYQCGDSYTYKPPVTQSRKYGVDVAVYRIPGCVLAGVYHTHPQGDASFSTADIGAACQLQTRLYIGPHGGRIRVLDCRTLGAKTARALRESRSLSGEAI